MTALAANLIYHEQELISSAKNGSRHAYGELVSRYWGTAFNLVHRMYGDPELAQDASQEAFIRGWQKIHAYRPEHPFKSWICRIAINTAVDMLRRRKPEVDIDAVDQAALVSHLEGPEESLEHRERTELVRRAVLSLPFESRAALVLREYEGLSYAEIADALSIPLGTVMSRLNYARTQVRKTLTGILEE